MAGLAFYSEAFSLLSGVLTAHFNDLGCLREISTTSAVETPLVSLERFACS